MLPAFFVENRAALVFYAILILVIVALRKRIEWQTFGIGLYKTKIGLKLMERWGTRYRGLVQLLGMIGVGVGFVGMAAIAFVLFRGLFDMIGNPAAPPVVSPVIPGFKIWGHDLTVPLITGWLALFLVIVIHEFSHGVVSRAHGVKVKSSGLLVFGPIGGAFVEPDEKKLSKEQPVVQYSLFAAGPWSNIVSGFLLQLALAFLVVPAIMGMSVPSGIEIASVTEGFPAVDAGLSEGMIITGIDGGRVRNSAELDASLSDVMPGDEIIVGTDMGDFPVVTTESPEDPSRGYIGITLRNAREPVRQERWFLGLYAFMRWLRTFVEWTILLSFGIGLANLLPIGPVDGGRMLQTAARQVTGDEKRGDLWWKRISLVTLGLLCILLLVPVVRFFL